MNADWFLTLLDYHYWANKRLLASAESLTPEQFRQDLGSSFPSIQATFAHMLTAETTWLGRLTGEAVPRVSVEDVPSVSAIRERWAALEARCRAILDVLAENRNVEVRTSNGTVFTHTVSEILPHLVNHGTYHRGQLTTMLRQVGAVPAATDMILYFRVQSGQM